MRLPLWRPAMLLAGVLLVVGGPQHPSPRPELPFDQSTALMLGHSGWVPSHLFMLAAFCCLLAGLLAWRRQADLPPASQRWVRFGLLAVGLAVVEMAFHTAAVVDRESLQAGRATPVLTTHLVLAATVNPLLAIGLTGIALHGARLRQLGTVWAAWVVVLGSAIFGFASTYVVVTHDQRVSPLFAIGSVLMALWFVFAAVWPVSRRASDTVHATGRVRATAGTRPS